MPLTLEVFNGISVFMCGFVGIFNPEGTPLQIAAAMTQALWHRGPDDGGLVMTFRGAPFVEDKPQTANHDRYDTILGFRRLSILDLSENGHQPMVSPDGRYAITFNGEVYNFQELRAALQSKGHVFRSHTDTETVLYSYIQYGPKALESFNGMFAFAIYDRLKQELFLARDRLGIKPLYYFHKNALFMVASETKALLSHPEFQPRLNHECLDEYLLFRYLAGENTLLEGVKSLPPGTHATLKNNNFTITRYWDIPASCPEGKSFPQTLENTQTLLQSSLRYQLISDVKVGCQLSGGVDSSLVSALAKEQQKDMFDSVSIIFKERQHSEEEYINEVNSQLGLTGHQATLDLDGMFAEFTRATHHFDFPLSQPNSLGILLLAKEAKKHVTVLLSGEGADEVFGGYDRYHTASWLNRLRHIPGAMHTSIWRKRSKGLKDFESALLCLTAQANPEDIKKIYPEFSLDRSLATRRSLFDKTPDSHYIEKLLSYDQKTYLVELLLRQDKMCMAHSIENRVPFLDHRVVEFAKTIPTGHKIKSPLLPQKNHAQYSTKKVLKELAAIRFGKPFAYRSKMGFSLPLKEFFQHHGVTALWEDALHLLNSLKVFDTQKIHQFTQNPNLDSTIKWKWTLLSLAIWLKGLTR